MKTQIKRIQFVSVLLGGVVLAPAFALAVGVDAAAAVNANVTAQTTGVSASSTVKVDAKLQAAITKADKEIDRRIGA